MKNLLTRKIDIEPICTFCHEHLESTDHILLHCNISKEIWSLLIPNAHQSRHLSTVDFVAFLWKHETKGGTPLSAFIGWNIWKARNKAIFNKEKIVIPHIIHSASTDHHTWIHYESVQSDQNDKNPSLQPRDDGVPKRDNTQDKPRCLVACSWLSSKEPYGLAWKLYPSEQMHIQGEGSFPATPSAYGARASAILEACQKTICFGSPGTIILSDAKNLIDNIHRCLKSLELSLLQEQGDGLYVADIDPTVENIARTALSTNPPLTFQAISKEECSVLSSSASLA